MEQEIKTPKGGLFALMAIIIVILVTLLALFATGTISFNNKNSDITDNNQSSENVVNDNNTTNDNNEEQKVPVQTDTDNNATSTIQTKRIDNLRCNNSETTFNGVTIKLDQVDKGGVCYLSSLLINNNDLKDNIALWVNSYEYYDDNVIIHTGSTSGVRLVIYNVTTNSIVMKLEPNTLNGYWPTSYVTNNNVITINGEECGDQCSTGTTGYKYATFETEYSNGTFTTPKLVSQTN